MAVLETKPFEPSEDPAETSMNGSAARTMNALKLGMTREGLLARRGVVARRGTWEAVVSRIGGEKVMTSGSKGAAAWETMTVRVQMLKTTKKKREYVITQTELRARRR